MSLADVTYRAFCDELEKIALSSEDVPSETPITTSTEELMKNLQPGDIIATKFTKPPIWSNPKRTEWFQRIKGAPKDLAKWTHLGVYVGDGKIRHIYPPFKQQGLGPAHQSELRDQSIKKLERIGREFLVMRPQTSDEVKQEAIRRTEEIKGVTTYSNLDMLRAGFWSGEGQKGEAKKMSKEEMEKAICTAVPAYAYPTFDFGHGKSIKTLLPSDVLAHRKLTPVIAYSDLEKTSVSLPQLRGLAKRVGAKRLRPSVASDLGSGVTITKPEVTQAVAKAQGISPDELSQLGKVREELGIGKPGIYLEPGMKHLRSTMEVPARAQQGLRDVVTAHEVAERAIRPERLSPGFSHLSPDVLIKEHNLLASLTGRRGKEMARKFRSLRGETGEAPSLERALQERFGPEAKFQFGRGKKIPKAMRKKLLVSQEGETIGPSVWGQPIESEGRRKATEKYLREVYRNPSFTQTRGPTWDPREQEQAMNLFLDRPPQNPSLNRETFFSR